MKLKKWLPLLILALVLVYFLLPGGEGTVPTSAPAPRQTAELSLPLNGLSLAEPAETLIRRAESLGRLETLLTLEDGKVTYTEYGQGK